jgi:DNA-binding response OmpR family regulator
MKMASENVGLRAIVLAEDPRQASGLVDGLSKRGISARVSADPDEALVECRQNPPNLVIVGSALATMTGVHFLAELLKVSWKTSTILIADEEEEVIHDQTEGLGILGSIRTGDDMESLDRLLDRFLEIVSPISE